MKVSVIIPTYNREKILALTLRSLVRQKGISMDDMEVIICDDGSSDNTRELVEGMRAELDIHYLYQEDKGYRVALARNLGLKKARHDIVVLLDSGVAASEYCIAAHRDLHESPQSKTVVIGEIYGYNYSMRSADLNQDFDFSRPDRSIDFFKVTQQYLDIRRENYNAVRGDLSLLPAPWTLFWTTNVSFSLAFVRQVGLFEELFEGWGVEDIELGYRLHKAGGRYALGERAAALHYPHERDSTHQKESNLRNRELFMQLHDDDIVKRYMTSTALGFNLELLQRERHKAGKVLEVE